MQNAGERSQELEAIRTIVSTLEPLDRDTRQRVLLFSLNQLGIRKVAVPEIPVVSGRRAARVGKESVPQSIRRLKRAKSPRYATHMAAVVAYYLSELAPSEERKQAIGHEDVRTYFKKAGFPMPKSPTDVLIHAAQSGYFDYLGDEHYKLTEAGRNLVMNELPPKKK